MRWILSVVLLFLSYAARPTISSKTTTTRIDETPDQDILPNTVKWAYCGPGNKYVDVQEVKINPGPVVPSKVVDISIKALTKMAIEGGNISVEFPLLKIKEGICEQGRQCPVPEGILSAQAQLVVPRLAALLGGRSAPGRVRVSLTDGTTIVCVKVKAPVRSGLRMLFAREDPRPPLIKEMHVEPLDAANAAVQQDAPAEVETDDFDADAFLKNRDWAKPAKPSK